MKYFEFASKNKSVVGKDKKEGKPFIISSVYYSSYLEADSELLKKGMYFEKSLIF